VSFVYLATMTGGWTLVIFPVSIPLVVWVGLGLLTSLRGPDQPTGGWLLQLIPIPIPIAMVAIGTIFQCEHCSPPELTRAVHHDSVIYVLDGLLFFHLVIGMCLVVVARGSARLLSCGVQSFLFWCSNCALAIASMAISGTWI
jgi:hypothetical protein